MLLTSIVALAAPLTVKPSYEVGKGFRFDTEDGRFGLSIKSRIQLLVTGSSVDAGPLRHTFNLRRVRLDVSGHGFGTWNRWRLQLGFSDPDLVRNAAGIRGTPMLDAYWELAPKGPVSVRIGQFKVSSTRARIASTAVLSFVDRHVLDGEFSFVRDRGMEVLVNAWAPRDQKPRWVTYAGVFEGDGLQAGVLQDLGLLVHLRTELMPLGAFAYHEDADLERHPRPVFGLGGDFAHLDGAATGQGSSGPAPSDGGTTDMTVWTADAAFRWQGFALDGVVSGRHATRNDDGDGTPLEAARSGYGWQAQAAFLFPRVPVNLSARYGVLVPTGVSSMPATREIAGALSWYIAGHPYDLTADVTHLTVDGRATLRGRLQLELSL